MLKYISLGIIQLLWLITHSQTNLQLVTFARNAETAFQKGDSSNLTIEEVKKGSKIDYLAPVRYQFARKQNLIHAYSTENYYDDLTQHLSFLGDFRSIKELLQSQHTTKDTLLMGYLDNKLKALQGAYPVNASKVILDSALTRRVVMINEAHCIPMHRAFVYSLLEGLYKEGFRYLAMETLLNNMNVSLEKFTCNTGYYTCEPLGGELVRKALKLGYTLVAYEDTSHSSSLIQRDSAQARHIYEVVQKHPSARILVLAGYGHIQKTKGSENFVPMGYQFKNLSGIDPFCIDQTMMTEAGNSDFADQYYGWLIRHFPISKPSVLMMQHKPVLYMDDDSAFDVRIFHPVTTYTEGRADWYALQNTRSLVKPGKTSPKATFLTQAYYLDEWNKNPPESIVPADQTYIKSREAYYPLFLFNGLYKVVYRDENYRILKTEILKVE